MKVLPLDEQTQKMVEARLREPGNLPEHHPVWVDILSAAGISCRGLVAVAENRALGWLLYAVDHGPFGTVVNSTPLIAYGGPAELEGAGAAGAYLLEALRSEAEALDAEVLSVGTSPFSSPDVEELYRRSIGATHEIENFVQVHDLALHPIEQLPRKRRNAFRAELRRAERFGLRVVHRLTSAQFEQWLAIYDRRLREIGAVPHPEQFHRGAFERGVPAGLVEFWGVLDGEELIGGVMFLVSKDVAHYFSSAFLDSHRHLFPTTYLLDEAFKQFIARGVRRFNWQSSPGRGGVYDYKARWGAQEGRHLYMSALLKPQSKLFDAEVSEIKQAYPSWFILPFSAWPSSSVHR